MKIDKFSINLDEESTSLANSFLKKCDGLNYKSEGTRAREIDILLDRLLDVHYQQDNFHHEVPVIREIKGYIKEEDDILPNIEDKLIKNILICRIGNGSWYQEGVSPGAKTIYDELIRLLNSKQVNNLVKYLADPTICTQLHMDNCRKHLKELLQVINLDLQEPRTIEAIEYIINNVEAAKTSIFRTKELQECMKYL